MPTLQIARESAPQSYRMTCAPVRNRDTVKLAVSQVANVERGCIRKRVFLLFWRTFSFLLVLVPVVVLALLVLQELLVITPCLMCGNAYLAKVVGTRSIQSFDQSFLKCWHP
jgi:hypothetical protein